MLRTQAAPRRGGEPASRAQRRPPALALDGVTVRAWDDRARRWQPLLRDVRWRVGAGEHWAVLGANGAGKTTLLAVVTSRVTPSAGTVSVLGKPIGAAGMRDPRQHLGIVESTGRTFAARMSPLDVVMNGVGGSVAAQGRPATAAERARATTLLQQLGCAAFLDRRFQDCSHGERQRVLIARALMRRPELLLLDEPATGLDLPAREGLLHAMAALAEAMPELATVTVTHHVEELPSSTTHALLLRDGAVVASGPVAETLNDDALTTCFGVPVRVRRVDDRWVVRSARPAGW